MIQGSAKSSVHGAHDDDARSTNYLRISALNVLYLKYRNFLNRTEAKQIILNCASV